MSHVRQQLRDQMVTELDVIPELFGKVQSTRLLNLRKAGLPACNVYVDGEEDELRAMAAQGSRVLLRTAIIATEVYAVEVENIDDELDSFAVSIEKILGNSTLNNLAYDVLLASTSFSFDADVEEPTGVITLFWSVQYQTTEGDPEVAV